MTYTFRRASKFIFRSRYVMCGAVKVTKICLYFSSDSSLHEDSQSDKRRRASTKKLVPFHKLLDLFGLRLLEEAS